MMTKDEAYKLALKRYSWWWKREMVRNVNNAFGQGRLEEVAKTAEKIYMWSNYYFKEANQ